MYKINTKCITCLCLLSILACNSTSTTQDENSKLDSLNRLVLEQDSVIKTLQIEKKYFEKDIQRQREEQERFFVKFKEKDIEKSLEEGNEIYRLTYWEAEPFCPFKFVFRFENIKDSIYLFEFTEGMLTEVYDSVKITKKQILLSANEWNIFKSKLSFCMFWSLEDNDGKKGMDGWSYELEGAKYYAREKQYKKVNRWLPESSAFSDVCQYLILLSGLDKNAPCQTRKKEFMRH